MEFTTKFFAELHESFSSGVYLMNHSSESIHIWTIGTREGRLLFHDSWLQGPCPRVGLEVKIFDTFKKCFSTFLLWKQLMQIVGQTWLWHWLVGHEVKVIMTYISQSSDLALYLEDYFMYVHHIWYYESVWPDIWPQNNCRSLWLTFHGPVILCYILKTIWYMNIIIWDYKSVWPDFWPKNNCRSPWPIFHGPVILRYIFKTIWCMNIILRDYWTVWPDIWPQSKYKSVWPIFHGPVILPYSLKTVWCMYIVLWDYESVWPEVWPQNEYWSLWPIFHGPVILHYILKNEHHTLGLWVSMTRHFTSK